MHASPSHISISFQYTQYMISSLCWKVYALWLFILRISILWIFEFLIYFFPKTLFFQKALFFSYFTILFQISFIPSLRVREAHINFFPNYFTSSMLFLYHIQRGSFKFPTHFRISLPRYEMSKLTRIAMTSLINCQWSIFLFLSFFFAKEYLNLLYYIYHLFPLLTWMAVGSR